MRIGFDSESDNQAVTDSESVSGPDDGSLGIMCLLNSQTNDRESSDLSAMQSAIEPVATFQTSADLSQAAREAIRRGVADSTKRAYGIDRRLFREWCAETYREPMPASETTLIEYVTHLAYERGLAPSTIERKLSAIRTEHAAAGIALPKSKGIEAVLGGYRDERAQQRRDKRAAKAATIGALRAMTSTLDRSAPGGRRDAMIILLGFAAATRRSELAAVDFGDVTESDKGIEVRLFRRKTHKVQDVAILYGSDPDTCPVRAFRAWRDWMTAQQRAAGPICIRVDQHGRIGQPMTRKGRPIGSPDGRMSGQAIADVVTRAAEQAGLVAPDSDDRWTGHSLRRGFATAAKAAGGDTLHIGRHGGWADGSRTLLGYIEEADRWTDNPLRGIGL